MYFPTDSLDSPATSMESLCKNLLWRVGISQCLWKGAWKLLRSGSEWRGNGVWGVWWMWIRGIRRSCYILIIVYDVYCRHRWFVRRCMSLPLSLSRVHTLCMVTSVLWLTSLPDQIYVHSKVLIVDDLYAIVGMKSISMYWFAVRIAHLVSHPWRERKYQRSKHVGGQGLSESLFPLPPKRCVLFFRTKNLVNLVAHSSLH